MPTAAKVPVGPTSVVGYGLALLQLVLAGLLYAEGEHQAAYALLASGNVNALLVGSGRYLQAHKLIPTVVSHVDAVAAPSEAQELEHQPPAEAP